MRCPKCHYLSFDPEPRCKNCGYGFTSSDADLVMTHTAANDDPLADLDLRGPSSDIAFPPTPPPSMPKPAPAVERVVTSPAPPAPPAPATAELPLFVRGAPAAAEENEPLIKLTAELRQPLSVRRKAPDTPAPRARTTPSRKLGPLDRDLLEDLQRIEHAERRDALGDATPASARSGRHADRASKGQRMVAAALDASLLAAIGAGVVWVTLRWCDLSIAEAAVLPVAPLAAFLLLLGLGYLAMFTVASGQTPGKMAAGIRVVGDTPADDAGDLSTRQALLRSLFTLPSVLALGLGFLLVLFGDERTLHDRLSHTRVVRA